MFFYCGKCGNKYAWQVALSGRRVRCKCGEIISVPEKEAPTPTPAPPEPIEVMAAPTMPVSSAHEATARYPTRARPTPVAEIPDQDESIFRDRIAPILFIVLGIGLHLAAIANLKPTMSRGFPREVGLMLIEQFLGALVAIFGVIASSRMLDWELPALPRLVFKALSASVFTIAVFFFVQHLDLSRERWIGPVVAWQCAMIVCWVLMQFLFKLELLEGMLTAVLTMCTVAVGACILWRAG